MRRPVAVAVSTVVALAASTATVAGGAHAAPYAAADAVERRVAAPLDAEVRATTTFSPNGDGRRDEAVVRIVLPRGVRVILEVREGLRRRAVRTVDLGFLRAGTHRWAWDGRDDDGRLVRDEGEYRISAPALGAGDSTQVDLGFHPRIGTSTFGAARRSYRPTVYPRTRVADDRLLLAANTLERRVDRAHLVVRDRRGDVVLRRSVDADHPLSPYRARDVLWSGRSRGKALPPGRYTAVVKGRDRAGNVGRSDRLAVRVSPHRLVWTEEVRTVQPLGQDVGDCGVTSANGCDSSDCHEPVPSTLFPGGLSYRSHPLGTCPGAVYPANDSDSLHPVEFAAAAGVRGLAAARVSFSGAPTYAGEADQGTLTVHRVTEPDAVVSSGSGAGTDWVDDLVMAGGGVSDEGRLAPAVLLAFGTRDGDAVDVDAFRVEARYLVVAD